MPINLKDKNLWEGVILFFICLACIGLTFSNALAEIGVGVSLFFWLLKKIFFREKIRRTNLEIFFVLYLVFILFSFKNTEYFTLSLRGFLRALKYVSFFYVVSETVSDLKRLRIVIYVLCAGALLMTIDGFYQMVTLKDFIRGRTIDTLDWLCRVSASFCHSNDFGAYLIAVFFPVLSLGIRTKRVKRIFSLVLAACIVFLLVKTSSRGAWLGFFVGLSIFIYNLKKKYLLIFLLAVFIGSFFLPAAAKQRIKDSFDMTEGTTWERTKLWKGTFDIVQDYPFFGSGSNTYSKVFPRYKPHDYPDIRYAHNSFLQMASETGILGLLSFCLLLISVLAAGFKRLKADKNNLLLSGLIAGLSGFLVHSMFDNHLFSVVLLTLFWIYMATIFSMAKNELKFS